MTKTSQSSEEFANFDHREKNHRVGAECVWARMRAQPELPHSERYGGFHVVTRYADVAELLAKCSVYSSASGISFPELDFGTRMYPAESDPPIQRQYRELLSRFLTRDRVQTMESAVRQQAVALFDSIAGQTHVDFAATIGKTLPVMVSLLLLGVPLEDGRKLRRWVDALHVERGQDEAVAAATALTTYLEGLLVERARTAKHPSEDILASVALGRIDGEPMSLDEQVAMIRLLLFGGFSTVAIVLTTIAHWFATHPEGMERLRQQPELIEPAIEEFVRYTSPATYLRRTVAEDTMLGQTPLCKGEPLLFSTAAANRDPAKFDHPDEVVLDRRNNAHLGFGFGAHRCLGSMVAKLELRIAIDEMLRRYERYELDPDGEIEWESGENQGIGALPLILHPRAA